MAQDTQNVILEDLKKRYKKQTLSVIETAKEIGVSSTTLRQGIKNGVGTPAYRKIGMGMKRNKFVFPLNEVAKYLANTQQMY